MKVYECESKTEAVNFALKKLDRLARLKKFAATKMGMTPDEVRNAVDPDYDVLSLRVVEERPLMENVVLVDSCVFIGLLREGRDPITELTQRIPLDQLATCGMVRLEVIRGLSQPKARRILEEFMDVMLYGTTDNRLWEQATELAWKLGRTGVTLPLGDIIIATCAHRLGAAVLTYDKHFLSIPGIKVFGSLEELS